MPIVVRADNEPSAQNAEQSGDSNKAKTNSGNNALPAGRSFLGAIIGNMFSSQFFSVVDLDIRGDPYWMGQSNIKENSIAEAATLNSVQGSADPTFANFLVGDHMFVLSFRSGENYNEDTGLMQFDTTSDFFNGLYSVVTVNNMFKGGSFTQTLHAAKDVFAQKIKPAVHGFRSEAAMGGSYDNTAGATTVDTLAPSNAAGDVGGVRTDTFGIQNK